MSRTRISLAASAAALVALAAAGCAPQPQNTPEAAGSKDTARCTTDSPSLHKRGQLTVATDSPAYEPWFDSNTPSNGKGFESAVAYAVAERLGFERDQVKWVVEPFAHSYAPGPKAFDFDINQISITPQRAKAVDFSTSYYTANQAILTLDGSAFAKATSLSAFKDARIGVQVATTSYQAVLDQIKPSKQPSVFSTTKDEVTALRVHEDFDGPRRREHGVVHGGAIADLLGPRAREALDDSKLVAHDGVQHLHAVVVPMRYLVRGLDDERVALEAAARIPRPLSHAGG